MAAEDLMPEEVPPEVTQAAERNQVGSLRRVLMRVKVPLFGRVQITGSVYDFEAGIIYQGADDVVHVFPYSKVAHVYTSSTRQYTNGIYNMTLYAANMILANGGSLRLRGSFKDPAYARGRRAPVERERA